MILLCFTVYFAQILVFTPLFWQIRLFFQVLVPKEFDYDVHTGHLMSNLELKQAILV